MCQHIFFASLSVNAGIKEDHRTAVHLWFAAITARFSCSYMTNITTFQDPRRKKEGMNLERNAGILIRVTCVAF